MQPLEEVVRVPRIAPQSDLADAPLTRRIGPKPSQLRIGRRLAQNRCQPDPHSDRISDRPARSREHRQKNRPREQPRQQRLHLVEDKEKQSGAVTPTPPERLIAPVFFPMPANPRPIEEQSQAKRPARPQEANHCHARIAHLARSEPVKQRKQADGTRPADIDRRGIPRHLLPPPEDDKQQRHQAPAPQQLFRPAQPTPPQSPLRPQRRTLWQPPP